MYKLEGTLKESFDEQRAVYQPTFADEVNLLRALINDAAVAIEDPKERLLTLAGPLKIVTDSMQRLQELQIKNREVLCQEDAYKLINEIVLLLTERLKTLPNYYDLIDTISSDLSVVVEENFTTKQIEERK